MREGGIIIIAVERPRVVVGDSLAGSCTFHSAWGRLLSELIGDGQSYHF